MEENGYRLVRSARKTLAIQVKPNGEVTVRAPQRMPDTEIRAFVAARAEWIAAARARLLARTSQRVQSTAVPGGRLWYLGDAFPVLPQTDVSPVWDGSAFYLPAEEPSHAAAAFFAARAKERLPERAAFWAEPAGISGFTLTVGSARGRWGSCSGEGRLRFSWRLLCTPPEAVDYVVAHELAHIRQHNHSPAFWCEVERIWPAWQTGASALRAFERRVDLSGL